MDTSGVLYLVAAMGGTIGTAATIVLLWGRPPRVWLDGVRTMVLVLVVAANVPLAALGEWSRGGGDVGIAVISAIGGVAILAVSGGGWVLLAATGAFRAQQVDAPPVWRRRVARACMVSGLAVPAFFIVGAVGGFVYDLATGWF